MQVNIKIISAVLVSVLLAACGGQSASENEAASHTLTCDASPLCNAWLSAHNDLRSQLSEGGISDDGTQGAYPVPATALPDLQWDAQLAAVAQQYADKCSWGHNRARKSEYQTAGGTLASVGENIAYQAYSSTQNTAADVLPELFDLWAAENIKWHYQTYQSATINGAGHFTQLIWANTTYVGCAISVCSSMANTNVPAGYTTFYAVCDYATAGNYIGQYPYGI